MKRIWRMAGVGLLVVSVSAQVTADERDNSPGQGQSQGQRPQGGGGQHERGPEGGGRPENNQPRPQTAPSRPENNQPRPENPHFDRGGPNGGGQRSEEHTSELQSQ